MGGETHQMAKAGTHHEDESKHEHPAHAKRRPNEMNFFRFCPRDLVVEVGCSQVEEQ